MKLWFVPVILVLTSSISQAAGGWAAIAYDTTTGRYGYSSGAHDKQQAESDSITACKSRNCQVVVSVQNGWASLSIAKNNSSIYGAGYAPTRHEAMYWSMFHCNQGPSACKVINITTAHE